MKYRVRWTVGAADDLERLHAFIAERDPRAADRAIGVIRRACSVLSTSPFSCRKAWGQDNPRFREIVIPFGHAGYVALFEIERAGVVFIAAVRHQREEDYH